MSSTPPPRWSGDELAAIDATDEVDLATRRTDGTLRRTRTVWIVRHSDTVYVRSINGTDAVWYRGVQTRHQGQLTAGPIRRAITFTEVGTHADGDDGLDDALDGAYRAKYGRWPGPVARITAEAARAATLRLGPA